MIKGFRNKHEILDNPIKLIQTAIKICKGKTRVINLSFSYLEPQPTFTKVLDNILYENNIVAVISSGNISEEQILFNLNNGQEYPDYLFNHHIYFPGDCRNAITVGSFTNIDSNFCKVNFPSPFTRTGIGNPYIKPDLVEYGGNITINHMQNNIPDDISFFGINVPAHYDNDGLENSAGTSFSAPSIATIVSQILANYPFATPSLVKSLLLASSTRFNNDDNLNFDDIIQGFGLPSELYALKSMNWRVSYMFQGEFLKGEYLNTASCNFYFPNRADKVTLTIVISRPHSSNGFIKFEMHKGGTREHSKTKPDHVIGDPKKIESSFQGTFRVKRGGIGEWSIKLISDFEKSLLENDSIKYGCIVTVESSNSYEVYSEINKWMIEKEKSIIPDVIEVTK